MLNFRKIYFRFCANCAKKQRKTHCVSSAKIAQKFAKKMCAKIAQILRKRFIHFVETLFFVRTAKHNIKDLSCPSRNELFNLILNKDFLLLFPSGFILEVNFDNLIYLVTNRLRIYLDLVNISQPRAIYGDINKFIQCTQLGMGKHNQGWEKFPFV